MAEVEIRRIVLGMVETNCYIFRAHGSDHCGIVDPADSGEKLAELLQREGLTPDAVLLTHSHFDHILGIPGLRKTWPDLPVYCHGLDTGAEKTVEMFGMEFPTVSSFGGIRNYEDGDQVTAGGLQVEVIHTPGHTPGSVVLKTPGVLFTGDTLFQGSVGRTDLPGGDARKLMESLSRLGRLEGQWEVYPGHGEPSDLDTERHTNPWLCRVMGKS